MNIIDAEELAHELIAKHKLTDWTFKFDRAVRRFGLCNHTYKTIQLSAKLVELNSEEHVTNTILHEIAHALVDANHGHDNVWKQKCIEVGCRPVRCYSSAVIQPKQQRRTLHQGVCPNCERRIYKYKRNQIACGVCCRKFNNNKYDEQYLIQWRS